MQSEQPIVSHPIQVHGCLRNDGAPIDGRRGCALELGVVWLERDRRTRHALLPHLYNDVAAVLHSLLKACMLPRSDEGTYRAVVSRKK